MATAPAALGHDLSCVMDLDPLMVEVDGRLGLAQSIARRLITPRGGLIDDPNYGFDLRVFLNGDTDGSKRTIAIMAQGIEAECLKDERVQRATATVTFVAGTLTVGINLVDGQGPFSLVLAISSVTASILKVAN